MIVVLAPPLQDYLGFTQGVENLTIKELVSQGPIEGLVVAVLPWRSWGYEKRPHADLMKPLLRSMCRKFGTIV